MIVKVKFNFSRVDGQVTKQTVKEVGDFFCHIYPVEIRNLCLNKARGIKLDWYRWPQRYGSHSFCTTMKLGEYGKVEPSLWETASLLSEVAAWIRKWGMDVCGLESIEIKITDVDFITYQDIPEKTRRFTDKIDYNEIFCKEKGK